MSSKPIIIKSASFERLAGRKKIRDRGIDWVETYKDKSESLKKKFEKHVGKNAYVRWEGDDFTTNSTYYVVVGPTFQRDLGKCFFAGIKKLPNDPHKKVYSPAGEYFTNIVSAFSHASEKWGTPFPDPAPQFDTASLTNVNISEHIKG